MVYYFTLLTVAYLAGAGFVLLNIFGLFTLVMETEKMDENEWDYHGEGNKSMIVAHSQRCIVLRFLKFLPHRNLTADEVYQHLHNILDFGKHVMKQFLGENYVHHGEVVKLPLDFLKHLCLKVQSERPGDSGYPFLPWLFTPI